LGEYVEEKIIGSVFHQARGWVNPYSVHGSSAVEEDSAGRLQPCQLLIFFDGSGWINTLPVKLNMQPP
jgi:hypothetical protein